MKNLAKYSIISINYSCNKFVFISSGYKLSSTPLNRYKIINDHGITVMYFDCDSPASDHKRMFQRARKNGTKFIWINPLAHGKSATDILKLLRTAIKDRERFDDKLLIFDTLKKFVNVMDKRSVKPFYEMLRQLLAIGATIVLLGHANKYRDTDGNLVFEGVGDILSDTDALILFERIPGIDGTIITTVVDPDKGAKVRGLYEPISFHISNDRTVTQNAVVLPVPDLSKKPAKKSTEEIEDLVRAYLEKAAHPVKQYALLNKLKDEGISFHQLRDVLNKCAVPESDVTYPGQIYFTNGEKNAKEYALSSPLNN